MLAETRRRGFTVLELLCALGILAALLAVALPRLSAVWPRVLADQAVRQLAADLELARVKAINRNSRVRAAVEIASAEYRIEVESEGRFDPEGGPRRLPEGIVFDAAGSTRIVGGRISITFLPRGHTADNATIAISASDGQRRRVIVSSAGRVRTE